MPKAKKNNSNKEDQLTECSPNKKLRGPNGQFLPSQNTISAFNPCTTVQTRSQAQLASFSSNDSNNQLENRISSQFENFEKSMLNKIHQTVRIIQNKKEDTFPFSVLQKGKFMDIFVTVGFGSVRSVFYTIRFIWQCLIYISKTLETWWGLFQGILISTLLLIFIQFLLNCSFTKPFIPIYFISTLYWMTNLYEKSYITYYIIRPAYRFICWLIGMAVIADPVDVYYESKDFRRLSNGDIYVKLKGKLYDTERDLQIIRNNVVIQRLSKEVLKETIFKPEFIEKAIDFYSKSLRERLKGLFSTDPSAMTQKDAKKGSVIDQFNPNMVIWTKERVEKNLSPVTIESLRFALNLRDDPFDWAKIPLAFQFLQIVTSQTNPILPIIWEYLNKDDQLPDPEDLRYVITPEHNERSKNFIQGYKFVTTKVDATKTGNLTFIPKIKGDKIHKIEHIHQACIKNDKDEYEFCTLAGENNENLSIIPESHLSDYFFEEECKNDKAKIRFDPFFRKKYTPVEDLKISGYYTEPFGLRYQAYKICLNQCQSLNQSIENKRINKNGCRTNQRRKKKKDLNIDISINQFVIKMKRKRTKMK